MKICRSVDKGVVFLAPKGAQEVKMCVRASVRPCVRVCDIMLTSTLEEFLRVLKSLK